MQADVPSQARPRRAETKHQEAQDAGCKGDFFLLDFSGFFFNVSAGCEPQRFSDVVAGLELEVQE